MTYLCPFMEQEIHKAAEFAARMPFTQAVDYLDQVIHATVAAVNSSIDGYAEFELENEQEVTYNVLQRWAICRQHLRTVRGIYWLGKWFPNAIPSVPTNN